MIWVSIAAMMSLLILGVPVYLGVFVGVLLIVYLVMGTDPMILTTIMFNKINMFPLLALPFFLLAGYFLAYGGAAKALIDLLNSFMRQLPGGPAYVIVVACTIFAAMSSSSMAAVAGFAPIMLPMMADLGYDKKFSIGLLICSATLGPMIPPSILLIMYGVIAEQSIRTLYLAAFIPGLMIAVLLGITVFFWSIRGAYTRQTVASWGERWSAIKRGWPVMIMPPLVLGPIYAGWVTPTEAGAVCAVYAFFLGTVVYRDLGLTQIWASARTTVRIAAMIYLIIMAAYLLNFALTWLRAPFELSEWVSGLGLAAGAFTLVTIILYILMGMFLDPMAILVVGIIILLPTVIELGISPIVYGIYMVMVTGIAAITPPYGMLLFLAVGILKEPFQVVVRGCFMFYPALIAGLFLIAYVPQISLWLPNLMGAK